MNRRFFNEIYQGRTVDIGGRIYYNELSNYDASVQYRISTNCASDYMRMYHDTNNLPNKGHSKEVGLAIIIEQGNVPEYESYESMTKEELIRELVKVHINEARQKKIRSEVKRCGESVRSFRQQEYKIILELSGEYPVKLLCEVMEIRCSSFYNWKKHIPIPFVMNTRTKIKVF